MRSDQRTGLLLALGGFTLLSVGDAVIKSIAGAWPGSAVAAVRYALGAVGLAALLAAREGRAGFAMPLPGWQMVRGFGVGVATSCFFSALFLMPLATATAITFTSPLLTALLAAAVLRERISRATWIALPIAFTGVLIVLRPNFANLGWAALLPLGAASGMAAMMVGHRRVVGTASALAMQAYAAAWAVPLLISVAVIGHLFGGVGMRIEPPHWSVLARCAVVAVTASAGHWLVYLGTARASASAVAPMTYVQLIAAAALGWSAFGEAPDALSLAGAAVIVGAGLILWWSGGRQAPELRD